jgi:RNase P protein component
MKRRVRETVRRELGRLAPHWRIVWNLRRASENAPQATIAAEVARVLDRCKE